jgi:hypothetical protein
MVVPSFDMELRFSMVNIPVLSSLLNANLERGTTVGMGLQNIKRATSIVHVLRFKISNCLS